MDTVKYLRHVIRPGTLEVDEVATAALTNAKPPKNQTELRSFSGLSNVYRRFVPNYSHVAAPLSAFLKKGKPARLPQDLGKEATNAFDELVKRIITPPVLDLPREGLPYEVGTDAYYHQVGAALIQVHPSGERKPIGFWSKSLLPAEKNYLTREEQRPAVVWALQTLRPYLQGEKFTVHSDQASLRWLLTIAEPSGRLMRWRLRLSEFDFQILYKTGKLNTQADALSSLATLVETTSDLDEDIPCILIDGEYDEGYEVDFIEEEFAYDDALLTTETDMPDPDLLAAITLEELVLAQASYAFCKAIFSHLIGGGEDQPFAVDDRGFLSRYVKAFPQIMIPQTLKPRVVYISHHAKLAAHSGGRKMYGTLRSFLYWPSMAVDAYAVPRNCLSCAKKRIP